jgi:hypothetical protein
MHDANRLAGSGEPGAVSALNFRLGQRVWLAGPRGNLGVTITVIYHNALSLDSIGAGGWRASPGRNQYFQIEMD